MDLSSTIKITIIIISFNPVESPSYKRNQYWIFTNFDIKIIIKSIKEKIKLISSTRILKY